MCILLIAIKTRLPKVKLADPTSLLYHCFKVSLPQLTSVQTIAHDNLQEVNSGRLQRNFSVDPLSI